MGVFYETIPNSLSKWILEQKMFWVGTAPLSAAGHVNISPKGGPYFGVPDEKTFWYMDLSGSGNETISHLHELGNGRCTIMFNGFVGAPRIVRLWGIGRVIENGTGEFTKFIAKHNIETIPGTRSIITVDIHQVGSSCGFSVPFYDFKAHRPVLNDLWVKREAKFKAGKKEESMERYWAFKNAWSIDGLPGMKVGLETAKKEDVKPIKKMVGPHAPTAYQHQSGGYTFDHLVVVAALCFLIGAVASFYGVKHFEQLLAQLPTDSRALLKH